MVGIGVRLRIRDREVLALAVEGRGAIAVRQLGGVGLLPLIGASLAATRRVRFAVVLIRCPVADRLVAEHECVVVRGRVAPLAATRATRSCASGWLLGNGSGRRRAGPGKVTRTGASGGSGRLPLDGDRAAAMAFPKSCTRPFVDPPCCAQCSTRRRRRLRELDGQGAPNADPPAVGVRARPRTARGDRRCNRLSALGAEECGLFEAGAGCRRRPAAGELRDR